MATQTKITLGIHATGMYQKCIGQYLNRHGKPAWKIWYWPADDFAGAITQAAALQKRWAALKAEGKQFWDQDAQYQAEQVSRSSSPAKPRKTPSRSSGLLTVTEAFQQFTDHLERQYQAGQFTEGHYKSQVYRLAAAADLKAGARVLGSLPLPQLGRRELEAAVLYLCSRPQVTRHNYKGAEERAKQEGLEINHKMSATYAKAVKASLKACLEWLAEEGLWVMCSHWKQIWQAEVCVSQDELEAELEEQDGESVDHFELDELKALWTATAKTQKPEFWRSMILLALNCGFANEEAASLKVKEVKAVTEGHFAGSCIIERFRGKTLKRAKQGSWARWYLWPETFRLLKQTCHRMPSGPIADAVRHDSPTGAQIEHLSRKIEAGQEQLDTDFWYLTDDGKKLTQNNAIGQGWRRLVKAAKVRPLSFKYLRKTAAHIVKNELKHGTEAADMLLSHTEKGMITAYAGRDWDNVLRPATEDMRAYLADLLKTFPQDQQQVEQYGNQNNMKLSQNNIEATVNVMTGQKKMKKKAVIQKQKPAELRKVI